jgi:tRNA-splicing ligase RtcB
MKARELRKLGLGSGPTLDLALRLVGQARTAGVPTTDIRRRIRAVVADPSRGLHDPWFAELATALATPSRPPETGAFVDRAEPAPWRQWGGDLEPEAVRQMANACRLPVAVSGALMPDAHLGYGLPIGGVLATDNAVIPYAVGVDIACRMRLTVLDMPATALIGERDRLAGVIERETRFGIGSEFRRPHDHEVMDADWDANPVTSRTKNKARRQLGSSGSGNHFVELGVMSLAEPDLGLAAGSYVALLSHSGSRGAGATVAAHYSRLAMDLHPELPRDLKHLAWLDLDSASGQEYWHAMQLMGRYAAANHAVIHRELVRALRSKALAAVENHHNFAWIEEHGGRSVVVHRKGATPADRGVLGVIPGSMATPGYVVRGKGSEAALRSASHGAGRVMSRKRAKTTFTWSAVRKQLAERGVDLLSAGLDEVPGVYKDIEKVMAAQRDLVDVVTRFDPRIVKMAPAGERPED